MEKFYLIKNHDLEGIDLIEREMIQTEYGLEDSVIATFYDAKRASKYVNWLNIMHRGD